MDYKRDWLRLGNQGEPLFELLMYRLEDRLMGVCLRLGLDQCSNQRYWENQLPDLFCATEGSCEPKDVLTPGEALDKALNSLPEKAKDGVRKEFDLKKNCKKAVHPKKCREKKKKASEGEGLDEILDGILEDVNETVTDLPGMEGTG